MKQTVVRFFYSTLPRSNFPDHIRPIAAKLNLGLPTEAKHIKGQNRVEFPVSIAIAKRHLINRTHLKYLTGPEHALTLKYLSFYTSKPLQPLLIHAYAHPRLGVESAKAIVRNRTATRIRRAFCVALNKNGYNWLGAGISQELDTKGKQLFGTVVLGGEEPQRILLLDFPKLVDYFSQQIKSTIAPQLRRDVTGTSLKFLSSESELEPGILDEHRDV